MARKFLWLVAIIIGLVIVAAIVWRLFAPDLIRVAFVPGAPYGQTELAPAPNYDQATSWIARPDLPANPALWAPPGFSAAPKPAAAVFFVSPTAWISRSRWNAPLDDAETNDRLDRFTKMQASVFNGVAEVWVPRYRQATFGAFLSPGPDAEKALAVAGDDVARAFQAFVAAQPADRPLFIAGHSQGARHILRLLSSMDPRLKERIVAVYVVGWPVAIPEDLQRLQLPACTAPEQSGCIASWQSFAADGELAEAQKGFSAVPDVAGIPLGTRSMVCLNPLSGSAAAAGADRNAGMLADEALIPRQVGASCAPGGLLLISPTPKNVGPYVLPGGNFHVYDFSLFWANIRSDIEARLSAFGARTLNQPTPAGAA